MARRFGAPSAKVDYAVDIEALDAALERHYAENWPEVEAAFLAKTLTPEG
ncbi:MAG: hypothetical protein ACHP84_21010 [Caulobacterales bacterium]